MWNSEILKIKTPGQLITKIINCKTDLLINTATDAEVCCMCNEKFPVTSMKKADEVLSNSFGGFTQVFSGSFDTGNLYICKYCELTLVDNYYCNIFVDWSPIFVWKEGKEKGKGKFEPKKIPIVDSHATIAYWHDHENKMFRPINKTNRHELTEFFFAPPKGAFMIAFNKPFFGGQRSHYLCNGVINYNFGECKSYIATYLDKRFTVDLDIAKRYVELVKQYKQKVRVPADLEFYRKVKDTENIKNKKTKTLIEMINEVGEEFFVGNMFLIKVLNVLINV
jgi:hypothetical protein